MLDLNMSRGVNSIKGGITVKNRPLVLQLFSPKASFKTSTCGIFILGLLSILHRSADFHPFS